MKNKLLLSLTFLLVFTGVNAQIIIDHTSVDMYDDIPDGYIQEVKKMLIAIAGESHSKGYRLGLELLESQDANFAVETQESGVPYAYTENNLRIIRQVTTNNGGSWASTTGEGRWFCDVSARDQIKSHIQYCNNNNLFNTVVGFGWCWDMTASNGPAGTQDPVYNVRWAGRSDGGPDGSYIWGLDADDEVLTGNAVCMQTYIDATEEYNQFCEINNINTKVIFTTGPVDGGGNTGERGYQRFLKHEYIRDYVLSTNNRILFDYADILNWSDAGDQRIISWTDLGGVVKNFPCIHSNNTLNFDGSTTEDGDHIGERGALRLGKAMWVLLARLAGWSGQTSNDDEPPSTPQNLVASITQNGVSLSWDPSDDNVGVTDYQILIDGMVSQSVSSTSCEITSVSGGYHDFSVRARDAAGNISVESNVVGITITGLDQDDIFEKVRIYQSGSGLVCVDALGLLHKKTKMKIIDLYGRIWVDNDVELKGGKTYLSDVSFSKGIYIAQIEDTKSKYIIKFAVQ